MGVLKPKFRAIVLALLFPFILAACGGGSGGSSILSTLTDNIDDVVGAIETSLSGTVYTSSGGSGNSLFKAGRYAADDGSSDQIPASGATILVYDIDSTSTSATVTATTDSDGNWTVVIDPGSYVVFSVYLDLSSFTLKVDRIDQVSVAEGEAVTTEDQVVTADEESPSVVAILDDPSGEETTTDGTTVVAFDPSPILISQDIAIFFDESMNRDSVIAAISLKDSSGNSVAATIVGNGALTEFRLSPTEALVPEATYTLTINAAKAKDLVNNNLEASVTAAITTLASDAVLDPLQVILTKPADTAEDVPVFASISFGFNYSVKFESVRAGLIIVPAVEGRLEVLGRKATFFPKEPLLPNTLYAVTVGTETEDLSEQHLAEAYTFSFTTGDELLSNAEGATLDIVELIGMFQAAMDSGNYSALLAMMMPDFTFVDEYFDDHAGTMVVEKMSAKEFIEMLRKDDSMSMGFGDVERKSISKGDRSMLVEHFQNESFGDLYRGFEPPRYGMDFVEVEKEIMDEWGVRFERFMYILSGGQFDPNIDNPDTCAVSPMIAEVQKFDEQGNPMWDPLYGQPIMEEQTFNVVDGDCDATNSWDSDDDYGNDPWPQDMDENPENDPLPYNDNNLSDDLQSIVTSADEIWNSAEHYFIVSENGDWDVLGAAFRLLEIAGPQGWPYGVWDFSVDPGMTDSQPSVPEELDYNADGDWNPDTCPSDAAWTADNCKPDVVLVLQRIPVGADGTRLTAAELEQSYKDVDGVPVSFILEVLPNDVGLTVGATIDVEPDWWLMNDDGLFGEFDPLKWQRVMEESTDAVVISYYLETKVKLHLPDDMANPPISFPADGIAIAFVEIEITETWFPHPPYDPEHPERSDLNGDGVVDENDNTFHFFEHRIFVFKEESGEWKLAKIEMSGRDGGSATGGEFDDYFGLPIMPIAPVSTTGGPATGVGINPTFEWSFDAFPPEVTVGSVVLLIMEVSPSGTTTAYEGGEPDVVNVHVRGFEGVSTSFTYGSTDGEDLTSWVLANIEDFPTTDPDAVLATGALEDGKAYMWFVIAFKGNMVGDILAGSVGDEEELGESPPMLLAPGALPSGFDMQKPISRAKTKVQF